MGIDVYLRWDDIDEEDIEKQYTGWEVSGKAGRAGYLREAYHGGPYATEFLVAEAFEGSDPRQMSIFVRNLANMLGADWTVGEYPDNVQGITVPHPDVHKDEVEDWGSVYRYPAKVLRERLEVAQEIARIRYKRIYKTSDASEMTLALEGFVELAEEVEEQGKGPPYIAVSA